MNRPVPAVAGVIGWPVVQSKSPVIHRFWLETLGVDGDYVRFPVAPEGIEAAVRGIAGLGLRGVNVTAPHKLAVMPFLDRISPHARSVGAVNTIVVEPDGSLSGHNTDVAGFMEPLAGVDLAGHAVGLMGSGGAARAVLAGFRDAGVGRVQLFARNAKAGAELLESFGLAGDVAPLGAAPAADTRLLVNATSLGMAGKDPLPFDLSPLGAGAIVYDLVYAPLETALLKAARARGLAAMDGLSMLVGQAAEAFQRFYGLEPPRSADGRLRTRLTS